MTPLDDEHGFERFYLGSHRAHWLWTMRDVPLFVSHRTLRRRRTPFPRATAPWALDSGGFTEISMHGHWVTAPMEYIDAVDRYDRELGHMEWAAPQDWMCEPQMLERTGLTVDEHQQRTVENYCLLTDLAPDLGFMPILQGWTLADYERCIGHYERAGVDLTRAPVVGVGSVCRRQHTREIVSILTTLRSHGLRLHGLGVKMSGLAAAGNALVSADSMAWSLAARRDDTTCPEGKPSCVNCQHYALAWRRGVLAAMEHEQPQAPLWRDAA